jgi:Spy/CpxP family protein refolding chaperone
MITGALLLPLSAMAQQTPGDGQDQPAARGGWRGGPGRGMAMLAQKLNLTDQQKREFRQIAMESRRQSMAVRNDSSLNDADRKAKLQDVRKQAHQKMFAVLTPEQKEQLKQMREERKKEMDKKKGDQASNVKPTAAEDDDPFAGMTNDDDDGGVNGK